MTQEQLITIAIGALGALLGFLAKEAYNNLKASKSDLKDLTKEMQELKFAIVELKVEMKHLAKVIEPIPKVLKDLDAAHTSIREIKTLLNDH